jgi:hypothetical protein
MTHVVLVVLYLPLAALIIATVAGALLAPLDFLACRAALRSPPWPPRGSQWPSRPLLPAAPSGRPCGE